MLSGNSVVGLIEEQLLPALPFACLRTGDLVNHFLIIYYKIFRIAENRNEDLEGEI